MLKGLKRSFVVVVVVVLGVVETWVKNALDGTKNVQGNKKCAWKPKMFKGTKNVSFLGSKEQVSSGTSWATLKIKQKISKSVE